MIYSSDQPVWLVSSVGKENCGRNFFFLPWALSHWEVRKHMCRIPWTKFDLERTITWQFPQEINIRAEKAHKALENLKQIYLGVNIHLKGNECCPWSPYLCPIHTYWKEGNVYTTFWTEHFLRYFTIATMNLLEEMGRVTSLCWRGSCSETWLNYRNHQIIGAKWNWTIHVVSIT